MHEYMTRHMVALQPLTYADMSYETGQPFLATPIDAPYLERARRARLATVAEVPAPPPVDVVAAADQVATADDGEALEDAPDAVPDQAIATPRRRGRPRRVQV